MHPLVAARVLGATPLSILNLGAPRTPNLTPDEKIQRVLAGEIHIVSYPGTSQYSQGAPSACGLAALNTIRIDATAICVHWSSRGHLEPDHLFSLPLFHQAMKVYDRHDKLVGFESFLTMINSLQTAETTNDITAALITRPPEIVAILRVPLSTTEPSVSSNLNRDESIYAIFDSHSRPEHPDGAGLTLLPSIAAAAQHLTALLRVNINTGSPGLSWEAQLMSQFSAHLVRRVEWRQPAEERTTRLAAIYEANVGLLHAFDAEEEAKRLRSEVTELREKGSKHHAYSALDSKPKSPIEPKPVSESKKYPEGLSEDALLALKMQEEFDAEDQLLTELAAEEPEQSKNVFDCGICFETFHMGALAPMDGCDHKYCRECMRDYIKSNHLDFRANLNKAAGQALVEIIGLDEREYATYVELSLASLSVMVHCRKCKALVVITSLIDVPRQARELHSSCEPTSSQKWRLPVHCPIATTNGARIAISRSKEMRNTHVMGQANCGN
ncbi:zf-C3HC4 domain-containing protein [Rhizoctonia solani AG-1 IA]|uniref:Zf-C3HC4 domain-containing protein n=1 Tax=Thanatephorus cucumeris (strain AG1-IA) TaxID=983506 RepID=L8X6P3_THACA|nr:zf-C3HC4 domain-containing protein [Rhizoctonia solani AG-1 IA]